MQGFPQKRGFSGPELQHILNMLRNGCVFLSHADFRLYGRVGALELCMLALVVYDRWTRYVKVLKPGHTAEFCAISIKLMGFESNAV